jgi:hypothetical protein
VQHDGLTSRQHALEFECTDQTAAQRLQESTCASAAIRSASGSVRIRPVSAMREMSWQFMFCS